MKRWLEMTGVLLLTVCPAVAQTPKDSCSSLMDNASLHALPGTAITSAVSVAGDFTPPGARSRTISSLPPFCRVRATLTPTPESDIKIEIWLPATDWNGKLEGLGNGGLAGTISYPALATAIKAGYASVSTDTGHAVTDDTWLPNINKEEDYGYRSVHLMTVTAKAVVKEFYKSAAKYAYFDGCSTGGGQALGEAQLYPADYNGILAGAPQNVPTRLRAAEINEFQAASNDPASNLDKEMLSRLTAAALQQCGGHDAVSDGFLENPQECRVDLKPLQCKEGQASASCLTAPQIAAVEKIYGGLRDSERQLWPGLEPGSEQPTGGRGWLSANINGPKPFGPAAPFYSLGVLGNKDVDFHTVNLPDAVKLAEHKFPFLLHVNTNLDPFRQRGGKLILYHGWADPGIAPQNTVNYYGSVVERIQNVHHLDQAAALKETQKSVRLFMVPGMGHCAGGPGPDHFNGIDALDQWVEKDHAPDRILASHLEGGVPSFTRPLCRYPQVARYSGNGSRSEASNWSCVDAPFVFDQTFYQVK